MSVGFPSHSRMECSRGAPSPGNQRSWLAGEQAAVPQTRCWGWAHQNRTALEQDFSNDEGPFPDNEESSLLETFQTQPGGSVVFCRGGKVLCGALQLHQESRKLRRLPRAAAGQAGTLSNQLTTYQSPGVSYRVTLAPSIPPRRADSSEEMSRALQRG